MTAGPRWNPFRTLRGQLATSYGAVALVAVLVSGLYSAVTMRGLVLERVAADLTGEAHVVADRLAEPLARGELAALRAEVDRLDPHTTASLLVLDGAGQPVAASTPPPLVTDPDEIGFGAALGGQSVVLSGTAASRDDLVQVSVPIRTAGGQVVGVLSESYDFEDTRQLIWRVNTVTLAGGAAAAGMAALLGLLFASLVAGQVRRASAAVRDLADHGASSRLPRGGLNEETRELGEAVHRLAGQLAAHEQARREFASDVSHELHSLASAMRTAADALERGAFEGDPARARRFVAGLVGHTHRLGRLADDLLGLARIEAGRLSLELETLDLAELVRAVLDEWAAEAEQRGTQLEAVVPDEPIPVRGDSIRLSQALGNLVENALKHARGARAARVVVEPDPARRRWTVAVEDGGPGIPEDVLPRVFDRYFRVEGRMGQGPGGMGLGLAIARGIARAHGGDLVAENRPGGGARFTLSLPTLEDAGGHSSDRLMPSAEKTK